MTTFIVEATAAPKSSRDSTSTSSESSAIRMSSAKMTLKIRTQPVRTMAEYCENISNLCFWETAAYKIAENSVEWNQSVGDLGPNIHKYLCPEYSVKYVLLNGETLKNYIYFVEEGYKEQIFFVFFCTFLATTYFSIHNNRLFTNTRFDHDTNAPGPQMTARVQCQVTQRRNSVIQLRDRLLHFTVLDRNDNQPELHSSESNISVQLDSPYFRNVSLYV